MVWSTSSRGLPKIGVMINNAAQFINGSEQQPQFVIEMLQNLGVDYVMYTHSGREDVCGMRRSETFQEEQLHLIDDADLSDITTFIMICHIVEDTSALSATLKERLSGKHVVQFHCGNHCIFNAEDVVFNKHNVVRLLFNSWFTESWVFSMHHFASDYYEQLTGKPCRLMPYAWSPTLLSKYMTDNKLSIYCDPSGYDGPLTLCCFEPNLNITKTCCCPLLMMNTFYRAHPERVGRCFIFCTKHLLESRSFKDYVTFLDVCRDGKVEFYPRMAFPEIMNQMKGRKLNPVVIGHQIYNDQNYLSLEALHLGYPLVHNSPSIRNAGFFYEGWDLHEGVRQLEVVAEQFSRDDFYASYVRRSRRVLAEHHPNNATLLEQLASLLRLETARPPRLETARPSRLETARPPP
tara:strand:- start:1062 stop:2279 length:1218 start_codon:yes stop_codon:yes gene_type:complete